MNVMDPKALRRLLPLAILLASAGSLGAAYTAQYAFDLEPCILCLYQRIPFAVAGLLAMGALIWPRLAVGACALSGIVFAAGAGIAVHHVGVEQHWWASVTGCGGELAPPMTAADLKDMLLQKPPKPCDRVDWALFGISMAGYNVVYSSALAIMSLGGAWGLRKET